MYNRWHQVIQYYRYKLYARRLNMKKLLIALALATATTTASANFDFFGSNNDGEWKMGPSGPYWEEGSNWPEWTPMYWMEEFMDNMDDDDNFSGMMPFGNSGNNFSGMMPFGNNNNMPAMPYPAAPAMPYGGYQQMMPVAPVMVPQAPVAIPVMPVAPAPVAPVAPAAQ
jgi:hypothetical protein